MSVRKGPTAAVALTAALVLGGCGGSGGGAISPLVVPPPTSASLAPTSNPFRQTTVEALACGLDRSSLRQAVATYEAFNGRAPASMADLVAAHVLSRPSVLYEVHAKASGRAVLIPTRQGVQQACRPLQL